MTEGKRKKLTYLLGAVVALIWAVVIYRVVSGLFAEEDDMAERSLPERSIPPPMESAPDSFSLGLDYPDPFLKGDPGERRRRMRVRRDRDRNRSSNPSSKQKKDEKEEEKEEALPWPEIEFGGIVRNRSSERVVVLLSIDGKERLLKEGEGSEQVSLKEVWEDSVRVGFQKEERVIAKRNGRNGTY